MMMNLYLLLLLQELLILSIYVEHALYHPLKVLLSLIGGFAGGGYYIFIKTERLMCFYQL